MIVKCLATLEVNANDDNLYGTYMATSGTSFYMENTKEFTMPNTEWFVDIPKGRTEPPKKEFQIQGSLKYKKKDDPLEFGVTVGYEITQDIETDNSLAVVFDVKTTDNSKIPDGEYLSMFLKYRKKGDYAQ